MKNLENYNVSTLDANSLRELNGGIVFNPMWGVMAAVYANQAWESIKEGASKGYDAAMN